MPLQETSGTASYDAFGGGAAVTPVYIEDVYSTFLYTGNGSTQTITNGIDLAGKGGLVWIKQRGPGSGYNHDQVDTARGANNILQSNTANGQNAYGPATDTLTSFNSNGFSLGADATYNSLNPSGQNLVSWTFRKQSKFFDVVTYTGNGTTQNIAHSLGTTPGCVIVKLVDAAGGNWRVWHRGLSAGNTIALNGTGAQNTSNNAILFGNNTTYVDPTATQFTVGSSGEVNLNGYTYVAYLFAHNAGGFGLTGTDNVISCGSFTTDSTSRATVNLGYEPQWLLIKKTDAAQSWFLIDTMRGWVNGGADNTSDDKPLYPNLSNAEGTDYFGYPTATGFQMYTGSPSSTYIYIAIRRGPMKTPTSGTSVFNVDTTANGTLTPSMAYPDTVLNFNLAATAGWQIADRLRGFLLGFPSNTSGAVTSNPYLVTNSTAAESTTNCRIGGLGIARGTGAGSWIPQEPGVIASGNFDTAYWFKRAPGFFDEVCYTGTGVSGLVVNHNLGVTPELLIYKNRATAGTNWFVLNASSNYGNLNSDAAFGGPLSITLGSTSYTINTTGTSTNASGQTYVAYLFASCPGVSKVGSYIGNGSTQTINCGFTGGARFVLIKRTDSTGDWYVYDTARGMTTLTDPYLLLNSTAAESATLGSVTSVTGGFALNASILAAINANGGSYIYFSVA